MTKKHNMVADANIERDATTQHTSKKYLTETKKQKAKAKAKQRRK